MFDDEAALIIGIISLLSIKVYLPYLKSARVHLSAAHLAITAWLDRVCVCVCVGAWIEAQDTHLTNEVRTFWQVSIPSKVCLRVKIWLKQHTSRLEALLDVAVEKQILQTSAGRTHIRDLFPHPRLQRDLRLWIG